MKYQLVYFDDQIQNIELYQLMLKDLFEVKGFTDNSQYSKILEANKPHALLLDLHMPHLDGIDLCDRIKSSEHYNGCPIFFISGDPSDDNRLKTFQTGGIDFFNRQISEQELKLRLMSKIRIFQQSAPLINIGNLKMDSEKFTVEINGKPSELTLIETRILFYMIKAMPEKVEKDALMAKIWGEVDSRGKINVHLYNLKSKLWDWDHEVKIVGKYLTVAPL